MDKVGRDGGQVLQLEVGLVCEEPAFLPPSVPTGLSAGGHPGLVTDPPLVPGSAH